MAGPQNEDRGILDCLPVEVLIEHIIPRVAASSSDDFFRLKLSCKTLYDISYATCILKCVSLNHYNHFALTLEGRTFLDRCTIAENPEALYRTGMIQHFKIEAHFGFEYLKKAMNSGHLDATYAVGMILILEEGEANHKGMQIITDLKKIYNGVIKFKDIRQNFLGHLSWIKNNFIVGREMPKYCSKHPLTDSGWKNFEDMDLDCKECSCQQEIVHLWKYLPVSI